MNSFISVSLSSSSFSFVINLKKLLMINEYKSFLSLSKLSIFCIVFKISSLFEKNLISNSEITVKKK